LMLTTGETPTISERSRTTDGANGSGFRSCTGCWSRSASSCSSSRDCSSSRSSGWPRITSFDGRMRVGQALSASAHAASSRGFALPVLVSIVVGAAGLLACAIGVLVTAPAAYIAVAFLYRNAAGQPVTHKDHVATIDAAKSRGQGTIESFSTSPRSSRIVLTTWRNDAPGRRRSASRTRTQRSPEEASSGGSLRNYLQSPPRDSARTVRPTCAMVKENPTS
jgi:hypothetical protein